MKKATYYRSLTSFHRNMNQDIDLLMKIEHARKVVKKKHEKKSIFEAYAFRICANWERLVDDLIVDCLNQDTSRYAESTGYNLPKHVSLDVCKAIIFGYRYLDFRSIDELKRNSKKLLVDECNPFLAITHASGKKIDEFCKIRNYVAHRSDSAKRSLMKIYKNNYGMKRFIEPGSFLLAINQVEKIPRLGVYINNFKFVAHTMLRYLDPTWSLE